MRTFMRLGLEELRDLVGTEERHRRLHARFLTIVSITAVMDLLVATVICIADRSDQSDLGDHFGPSLVWTSSQLLTGGASYSPGTFAHVLEPFLELYAVTVVAALAGAFGSFFYSKGESPQG
jgi:hypothetical protein